MKAAILAVSAFVAPLAAQPEPPFADIPGIAFAYYDVPGGTLAAIRSSIERLRLIDPNDRQGVDALSNWSWRWSWKVGAGGCDLAGATLSFEASVRMPRLADRTAVPAQVLAHWDDYIAALERHEAWHVRNGYSGRAEIQAAIAGATCATADAAALAAVRRIGLRDQDYDRRTHHGIDEGATF